MKQKNIWVDFSYFSMQDNYPNCQEVKIIRNMHFTALEYYVFELTTSHKINRLSQEHLQILLERSNLNFIQSNEKNKMTLAQKMFYYHFWYSQCVFNKNQLKYIVDNSNVNYTNTLGNNSVMIALSYARYQIDEEILNYFIDKTEFSIDNLLYFFKLLRKFNYSKNLYFTCFDKFWNLTKDLSLYHKRKLLSEHLGYSNIVDFFEEFIILKDRDLLDKSVTANEKGNLMLPFQYKI